MSQPTLRYDVIADDKTAKGIKSAKNNISALEKKVTQLGKSFASVFAAQKIIGYAKDVSQAFLEDQKSAAILSNAVKNLGLSFADLNIKDFIEQLSATSGVVDDELRPAFQRLLQATKDLGKSKELLSNAIDISRGSGQSLETVVLDLSNAYVGNNKGLKKYTLGLTAAELKTASFDKILKAFNKNFSGSNQAYLKTYAGQLDRLKVAASESKEILGKGLIDSLALLGKDGSVGDLSQNMKNFATYTSNAIYGVASLASELKNLGGAAPSWLTTALKYLGKTAPGAGLVRGLSALSSYGEKKQNAKLENPSVQMFKKDEANNRINNAQFKKQQDAARKQLDATKKLTAEQKKQALLKKQSILFDMDYIQLIAALKGKLSDEERKRVELQLALLTGNEEQAAKLSREIANAIDQTGNLAKYLATLPDAKNPFKSWDSYLAALEKRIAELNVNLPTPTPTPSVTPPYDGNTNGNGYAYNPDMPGSAGDDSQYGSGTPWARASVNVTVNNAGSVISQSELNDSIMLALQNASLSGVDTSIARNLANFR